MDKFSVDKKQLQIEVNQKARDFLQSGDKLSELIIYNLENFAYRYLETSVMSNLTCFKQGNCYWVESIESDVFSALKWNHKRLKPILIELCKEFPGKLSKKISLKLMLGTEVFDDYVLCKSIINWDFPLYKDESKQIGNIEKLHFTDLLELRNHHASVLEKVSCLFIE